MEVLQCDGCDFRAESCDELKAHIQDVHTVFLQPTDVGNESPQRSSSDSLNSLSHTEEDDEDIANNECGTPHKEKGTAVPRTSEFYVVFFMPNVSCISVAIVEA